jgi:hypothetical protein
LPAWFYRGSHPAGTADPATATPGKRNTNATNFTSKVKLETENTDLLKKQFGHLLRLPTETGKLSWGLIL